MEFFLPLEKLPPEQKYYKVAVSFASAEDNKNRDYVRKVVTALNTIHKIPKEVIFFDEWAELEGSYVGDLDIDKIYSLRSEFIVPFFCHEYSDSSWTNGVEGNAIRSVKNKDASRVIPARLEEINSIQGFHNLTGISIESYKITPEQTAQAIYTKIDRVKPPIELLQVNQYVKEIFETELLEKWCENYIKVRDIFLCYEKNNHHVKSLRKYIPKWEIKNKAFNPADLQIRNLAEILDSIYVYSREHSNENHHALIKFLCVLCNDVELPDSSAINEIVIKACQYSNITKESICPPSSKKPHKRGEFPFTNRERELERVLNSKIANQLITAPISYGKETFIKKLENVFIKKGYVVFLKHILEQNTVNDIDLLCLHLGFNDLDDFLEKLLSKENIKRIDKNGLVLLFTTKNMLSHKLKPLKASINVLRRKVEDKLKENISDYHHSDIKIRLVVSSRQLYGSPYSETEWPYGFEAIRLSEFTNIVIHESLKEDDYFPINNEAEYESIVARMTLLTAGHPAMVKSAARYFHNNASFNIDFIKDDISVLSQGFATSIKDYKVKNLFQRKKIPAYRYINDSLLVNIVGKSSIKRQAIVDSLLSHGLYEKVIINGKPSSIIKDSLLRRICAIDYCYQEPDKFFKSLTKSQNFYLTQFKDNQYKQDCTILWLVEYLYSHLQAKLLSFAINEDEYNNKIGDINYFLLNKFPDMLSYLIENIKDKDTKNTEESLLERLKNDWELRLLFNYQPYQSDTQCYNKDTYTMLIELIKNKFAELQGENDE